MEALIGLIVWILIAHWIGKWAERDSLNYWTAFWLSLILTPIIGAIYVGFSQSDLEKAKKKISPEDLIKWNELKEKGIISEEEFKKQKEKYLK